ncbi:MAG: repeat protein [Thermoleophilia bacterium]|nr:repeat protein [Thermoleophilia bacterium]
MRDRPTRPLRRLLQVGVAACAAASFLALTTMSGAGSAASSSTVIGATVPSATTLSTGGCGSNVPGITSFGAVLPNASVVTTADCVVTFGSSNDTSMLRMFQPDGNGDAMWLPFSGALDQAFDGDTGPGNGIVHVDRTVGDDWINDLLVQPDGKVLVSGYANDDGILARFNTDGRLDTTFNGTGVRTFTSPDELHGLGLLPDGRIMVVGGNEDTNTYVLRLMPNGTMDSTWDGDGVLVQSMFPGTNEFVGQLAIQPDGKVLVAGLDQATPGNGDWVIARLQDPGMLDPSFSGDGVDRITWDGTSWFGINGLALEADGDIVVVGRGSTTGSYRWTFGRYKPDGQLDLTFSGDGLIDLPFGGGNREPRDLAILADGSYVTVGKMNASWAANSDDATAVKLRPDATLDPAFGTGGIFNQDLGSGLDDGLVDVVAMPDGGIFAVGVANGGARSLMARFGAGGQLDQSFSSDGWDSSDLGVGGLEGLYAAGIGRDGRVVAAGDVFSDANGQMLLTAWDSVAISDYVSGAADWDTASSTSMFAACLRQLGAGATAASWAVDGGNDCAATDTDAWAAIPDASALAAAKVAQQTTSGALGAEARLRFGLRPSASQRPGVYQAPIVMQVLAPNA